MAAIVLAFCFVFLKERTVRIFIINYKKILCISTIIVQGEPLFYFILVYCKAFDWLLPYLGLPLGET